MPATIDGVLARAAGQRGGVPALVCGETSLTFAALEARVSRLASAIATNSRAGGVVAVLSENSAAYVECLAAIPRAGRLALLLNYRHHPSEWAAMLARTRPDLVIGEQELIDALVPYCEALALQPSVFVTVDTTGTYEAFIAGATDALGPSTDGGAPAWLVPTSGTTGSPKLATLTHRSLLAAARGCALARPVADDDVYLFPFPLCHVAAYNIVVYHLHARPIVLLRRFDARAVLETIAAQRVTVASLAPTMIAALLDHPAFGSFDLSSLRTVGYGSSAIPEPLLRRAMAQLDCGFSQGYGMTELSGNCAFLDEFAHRAGVRDTPELLQSAGRAAPLVELQIIDDDGAAVAPGVVGEISVRGEQVMAGYFGDDEATAVAVIDGWLHTGDLGRLDADGNLFVVDRKKDVIVSGGESIASREVEAVLHAHPSVREVAVVGMPDAYWGEVVCAVIALREGTTATPEELVDHCRSQLASFKKPRHIVFADELPKNTTGKIEKQRIREELRELLSGSAG